MSDELERFVKVASLAARQAGALASRLQGRVERLEKPGHGSPESSALTIADLAAQDVLLLALHDAFPAVAVDAEEDTETVALFPPEDGSRPVVVIDPVDGTHNYSQGEEEWGVMVGWLEEGRFRAAVMYLPIWDQLLGAIEGRGAWQSTGRDRARQVVLPPSSPRVLVSPGTRRNLRQALVAAGLEPEASRCSAVDGAAPMLWGASSLAFGRTGRRRATALYLAAEAGASVLIAGQRWTGMDPSRLDDARISVAAVSTTVAAKVMAAAVPRAPA